MFENMYNGVFGDSNPFGEKKPFETELNHCKQEAKKGGTTAKANMILVGIYQNMQNIKLFLEDRK